MDQLSAARQFNRRTSGLDLHHPAAGREVEDRARIGSTVNSKPQTSAGATFGGFCRPPWTAHEAVQYAPRGRALPKPAALESEADRSGDELSSTAANREPGQPQIPTMAKAHGVNDELGQGHLVLDRRSGEHSDRFGQEVDGIAFEGAPVPALVYATLAAPGTR